MKQGKNRLLEQLTLATDLPSETVARQPLVEILGEKRVLIENHKGVAAYGDREIRIRVCYGEICVCGFDMELIQMTREQLVIVGCIRGVTLVRRSR